MLANVSTNASTNMFTNTTANMFPDTSANITDIFEFRYSTPLTAFFCVAYSFVFVVGVTGNCFVVSVVYRSKRMRNPMNIFIANLACADLLVNVLCLPFTLISNIMNAWVLGWLICKTVPYLQGVSVSASVYTLVFISIERCLAICYPMTCQLTSRMCKRTVVFIWVFSLVVTSPWVIYFQLMPLEEGSDAQVCTELWPNHQTGNAYFIVAHLCMCYLLPLAVISVCYQLIWRRVSKRTLPGEGHMTDGCVQLMIHRSKVKVVKMLFYVITLFACSWLPLYVIVCRLRFGGPFTSAFEEDLVMSLVPVAQWLGSFNSCINPILYAFLNRKFRVGFKAVLSSHSCCSPLHYGYDCAGRRSDTVVLKRRTIVTREGTMLEHVAGVRRRSSAGDNVNRRRSSNGRTKEVTDVKKTISNGPMRGGHVNGEDFNRDMDVMNGENCELYFNSA